jgi:hypothetical protein
MAEPSAEPSHYVEGTPHMSKPTVYISDAWGNEGDTHWGNTLYFKVWAQDNYNGVQVKYHTEKHTANEGDSDYEPKGGDLYLAPGKEEWIGVQVYGDTKYEDHEYFKMWLAPTEYYHKGTDHTWGTIWNDDQHAPPATIVPTDVVMA